MDSQDGVSFSCENRSNPPNPKPYLEPRGGQHFTLARTMKNSPNAKPLTLKQVAMNSQDGVSFGASTTRRALPSPAEAQLALAAGNQIRYNPLRCWVKGLSGLGFIGVRVDRV